jgi:hypothetical protein
VVTRETTPGIPSHVVLEDFAQKFDDTVISKGPREKPPRV